MNKRNYTLKVEFYGGPAYIINELQKLGLHGRTKEGVVERIIIDWIFQNFNKLDNLGINLSDAEKKGYIPAKIKKK